MNTESSAGIGRLGDYKHQFSRPKDRSYAYEIGNNDPYVHQLLKEVEFLKRENKRLNDCYLDTIEQSEDPRLDTSFLQNENQIQILIFIRSLLQNFIYSK